MCTTTYAVTRSGAQKLLLRTAIDMNTPIDSTMAELVGEGKIDQLGLFLTPIIQWNYRTDIPINDKNSEISNMKNSDVKTTKDEQKGLWKDVQETMRVWQYSEMHWSSWLSKGILLSMKDIIYGNAKNYS